MAVMVVLVEVLDQSIPYITPPLLPPRGSPVGGQNYKGLHKPYLLRVPIVERDQHMATEPYLLNYIHGGFPNCAMQGAPQKPQENATRASLSQGPQSSEEQKKKTRALRIRVAKVGHKQNDYIRPTISGSKKWEGVKVNLTPSN